MYRFPLFFISFTFLSFMSCEKEVILEPQAVEEDVPTSAIPAALMDHFINFEGEALVRGFAIDLSKLGITASFEDVDGEHVAGVCTTNGFGLRDITIDINFWRNASTSLREMIVFHELGHCALGQGHREGTFENGFCKSIMRSGTGECRDAYIAPNRDYYLDELFSATAP